jgi:hypothetical protein
MHLPPTRVTSCSWSSGWTTKPSTPSHRSEYKNTNILMAWQLCHHPMLCMIAKSIFVDNIVFRKLFSNQTSTFNCLLDLYFDPDFNNHLQNSLWLKDIFLTANKMLFTGTVQCHGLLGSYKVMETLRNWETEFVCVGYIERTSAGNTK